jgi:hypothetical protein
MTAAPNKSPLTSMIRSNATPALCIEHCVTADMADGQPLPPRIEDGVVWHVVHRADGCTTWRRLFLSPSPSASPATRCGVSDEGTLP